MSDEEIDKLGEKYVERMKKKTEEFSKIIENDKWKFQKEKKGIKLWTKKAEGSKIVMFKTQFFLEGTTPKEYYEYFYHILNNEVKEEIKKRTKTSLFYKIVKKLKDEFFLVHTGADTGRFVANREFLYFRKTKHHDENDDVVSVLSYPVDFSDDSIVPKSHKKIVRGILMMGHLFERKKVKEKEGVMVTQWLHTDPMGWLPAVLINTLAGGSALDIARQPLELYLLKKNEKKK